MDVISRPSTPHHYCFPRKGSKLSKNKSFIYIKQKTNQGHEISQIKCEFSVHYLDYNSRKLILGEAIGRGSRKLRILSLLKLLYELT